MKGHRPHINFTYQGISSMVAFLSVSLVLILALLTGSNG